jgi:Glycosyltransferase family 87
LQRSRVEAPARALIGSVLIVSCLAAIFYIYSRPSRNGFGAEHDFVTVIAGVRCAIDRCDPYDSPTLEREFPARMGGYTPTSHFKPEWPVYPPGSFLLLFPLSLLPWPVLSVFWMLSCFASLAAALVVLFLYFKAYRDVLSAIPFVILLADGSIGWAVQLGQPALIAASTLTLAIVALVPGLMPVTGGVLLAISLGLKPQGAFLCALYFLLLTRTRVPALAACLFTAAAAAGGMLLFYVRLGSWAYLGHLSANIKLAMQPGRDADFSRLNPDSASFLNLQAFLARFLNNSHLSNQLTYAACLLLAGLLVFVCWRTHNIALRPYTIVAVLVMIQLLGAYHRLYDHAYLMAAIPGLYEIKQRASGQYLLFVVALVVYHFSQLHGLTIHGYGPFSSGPPVELFIAGLCLYSLWQNRPAAALSSTLQ